LAGSFFSVPAFAVVIWVAPQKYGVHCTPLVPNPTLTLETFASALPSHLKMVTVSPSRSLPTA
jgi:hypothetical protein